MDPIAYVNGSFVPLSDAKISVLDRGFLFADGIYEVSAVLDGKLVDNASHLARLERSVGEIQLKLPETVERITELQKELIARNKVENGLVYLQVTRGADKGRDFAFPKGDVKSSLVMFTSEKDIINAASAKSGINVITVPDIRWERRDIKSVALLAQVLAKQAAAEAGAGEAWMLEDGYVTEGGSSSAFILTKDDVIVTRKNSNAILPGCTRKAVVALAEERQLRVEERSFTVAEALAAKEAFATSASLFVQPGGCDRRQEDRRWQARPACRAVARDLRGVRQGDGGLRTHPVSSPAKGGRANTPRRDVDERGLSAPASSVGEGQDLHRRARASQRRAAEADQSLFMIGVAPAAGRILFQEPCRAQAGGDRCSRGHPVRARSEVC
ncbi:D-amino acid aminotransferase [Bradyrhizobium sp. F1.13.4]